MKEDYSKIIAEDMYWLVNTISKDIYDMDTNELINKYSKHDHEYRNISSIRKGYNRKSVRTLGGLLGYLILSDYKRLKKIILEKLSKEMPRIFPESKGSIDRNLLIEEVKKIFNEKPEIKEKIVSLSLNLELKQAMAKSYFHAKGVSIKNIYSHRDEDSEKKNTNFINYALNRKKSDIYAHLDILLVLEVAMNVESINFSESHCSNYLELKEDLIKIGKELSMIFSEIGIFDEMTRRLISEGK